MPLIVVCGSLVCAAALRGCTGHRAARLSFRPRPGLGGGQGQPAGASGGHVAVRVRLLYIPVVVAELMRGFGYKTGWLAVRRGEIQTVASVLGGRITGSVAWGEGIAASYREPSMVAVTPPLRGATDGGCAHLVVTHP